MVTLSNLTEFVDLTLTFSKSQNDLKLRDFFNHTVYFEPV